MLKSGVLFLQNPLKTTLTSFKYKFNMDLKFLIYVGKNGKLKIK